MERYTETSALNDKLDFALSNSTQLVSAYPLGTVLDAFVTNVHNVPQLRFFMFARNAATVQHFANIRQAATPPNAYKCQRTPREGYVFALRLNESTILRAVRLPTMCITTIHKVYLPDIGRDYKLENDEPETYHLPAKLRKLPGLAVLCQLRGINDDVTLLPKNMRSILKGLLYRSVKLRVDGYSGDMLKVQLMDVTMDQLLQWTAELDEEQDLSYVLKNTIFYKSVSIGNKWHETTQKEHSYVGIHLNNRALSPIPEICHLSEDESIDDDISTPSISSIFSSSGSSDLTVLPASSCLTDELTLTNTNESDKASNAKSPLDGDDLTKKPSISENNIIWPEKLGMRPLLGCHPIANCERPITGYVKTAEKSWKKDVLPALMLIDNRQFKVNFPRDELLTITPTYIGQLERFFGVVHRRDECYLQHMWTDDEIPMSSRYAGSRVPYIFDIVLAKHSVDMNWYRAKVIEISKEKRTVLVFFVDYGGVEHVDLCNLAHLGRSISTLPFQAVLFRLQNLVDITTTKTERAFGVDLLRSMLLKKTLTVRVVKNRNHEIHICLEDERFSHVPATLIQKGLMENKRNISLEERVLFHYRI